METGAHTRASDGSLASDDLEWVMESLSGDEADEISVDESSEDEITPATMHDELTTGMPLDGASGAELMPFEGFLDPGHPLYAEAIQATHKTAERLEASTRKIYSQALRRFQKFCTDYDFPDPLCTRYHYLPTIVMIYMYRVSVKTKSSSSAETIRSALSWHFTKPTMIAGGHPDNSWIVEVDDNGTLQAWGNPARSVIVKDTCKALRKEKKREHIPKHARPMDIQNLEKLLKFTRESGSVAPSLARWYQAVASLAFYAMARINEIMKLRYHDIHLGLSRRSLHDPDTEIRYGFFNITNRKTHSDPTTTRKYYLHHLPVTEWACDALVHVAAWVEYAEAQLHHSWRDGDFLFPAILREKSKPKPKKRRLEAGAAPVKARSSPKPADLTRIRIEWGVEMSPGAFNKLLLDLGKQSGLLPPGSAKVNRFTSHCFRRGGAQHRFMYADQLWSLRLIKWWAGWAPDPARHLYRAVKDFWPEERSNFPSKVCRIKKIAEFVRERYNDDVDRFEQILIGRTGKRALRINDVVKEINSIKIEEQTQATA
ncbi:hypothetical protein BBJ28_00014411 [Nothophytophthora sp. Chile5]|nr:hypothetical protein BBJ28_00014411 [Nothophytophthora sp. Chile5]